MVCVGSCRYVVCAGMYMCMCEYVCACVCVRMQMRMVREMTVRRMAKRNARCDEYQGGARRRGCTGTQRRANTDE